MSIESDLSGLDRLEKNLEKLDGKHKVTGEELLPDDFIRENTNFQTRSAFLEASGIKAKRTCLRMRSIILWPLTPASPTGRRCSRPPEVSGQRANCSRVWNSAGKRSVAGFVSTPIEKFKSTVC